MKKGAGASPLFELTPQKTGTESRFGSGHPGKPILYFSCRYIVQTVCQRFPKEANPYNPFEKRDLTFRRQSKLGSIAPVTYKISQVRLQYIQHSGDSPFSQSQDRSISATSGWAQKSSQIGREILLPANPSLNSDFNPQRFRHRLTELLHIRLMLRFHHHARKLLRP